jgi:hypothetical protein
MSGIVIINDATHEWHICISCGVVYTIPQAVITNQRKSGGFHTCCNGHSQGWSKEESEDVKIRRERDMLRQQVAQKDDEIAAERQRTEDAKRQVAATRKQVTKLKVRANAGTCPCCNRTVRQMALHMKNKHPSFIAKETTNAKDQNTLAAQTAR